MVSFCMFHGRSTSDKKKRFVVFCRATNCTNCKTVHKKRAFNDGDINLHFQTRFYIP